MWLCANENDGVTDSKMKTVATYRIVLSGVCRIAWIADSPTSVTHIESRPQPAAGFLEIESPIFDYLRERIRHASERRNRGKRGRIKGHVKISVV